MSGRSTTAHQALYNSQAWRQASRAFRSRPENVLCVDCKLAGKLVPAEVTDHIVEHEGNLSLFWDQANWAPRCWSCHSSRTRRREGERRTGWPHLMRGCTATGEPLDPRHPWRQEC